MELIDREALSMELANEVLCAYAKADFREEQIKQYEQQMRKKG